MPNPSAQNRDRALITTIALASVPAFIAVMYLCLPDLSARWGNLLLAVGASASVISYLYASRTREREQITELKVAVQAIRTTQLADLTNAVAARPDLPPVVHINGRRRTDA